MSTVSDVILPPTGGDVFDEDVGHPKSNCHIRVQQRSGRKCVTVVQGLAPDLDLKKILKFFKKIYHTNGTVKTESDIGEILQFAGDQRDNMKKFLMEFNICTKDEITLHGF